MSKDRPIRKRRGIAFFVLLAVGTALATNIDPNDKGSRYGWTENTGWLNTYGDGVSAGSGLTVRSDAELHGIEGNAWFENVGWVNFGDGSPENPPSYSNTKDNDCGVNMDTATGVLSGYAWGENIGWINFSPGTATISISKSTGEFSGQAWGENIGWISFDGLDTNVATTDPANVPVRLSGFEVE